MTAARAHVRSRLADESGFTIVEVLATALVVLILAAGAMTSFDVSSKASGRAKSRSIAMTLAQSDQERMRALPVEQLSNLRTSQATTKQMCDDGGTNCVTYTITSQADWVNDASGVQSCSSGTAGFDYLNMTSTVTWPNIGTASPAVSKSMYTPPPGTFGTGQGAIAVKVLAADGTTPVTGATVSLAGTRSYTDVTNSSGCVFWGLLPVGTNYTVTTSKAGLVTPDGATANTQATSVAAQSVTTTTVQLDAASSATLRFVVKDPANASSAAAVATTLDQATIVNSGMVARRVFGTAGTSAATLGLANLFPFTTGYQVYGGGCAANDPNTQSPSDSANAQYLSGLTPGQDKGTVDLPLPPLDTKVEVANAGADAYKGGANGANMRAAAAGDAVRFRIQATTSGCANQATTSAAASSTNAARPSAPGYPYGTYTVCAEASVNGTVRRKVVTGVALNTLTGVKVTSPATTVTSTTAGPIGKAGVIGISANDTAGTCNAAF